MSVTVQVDPYDYSEAIKAVQKMLDRVTLKSGQVDASALSATQIVDLVIDKALN
jgi:hypothetical protein